MFYLLWDSCGAPMMMMMMMMMMVVVIMNDDNIAIIVIVVHGSNEHYLEGISFPGAQLSHNIPSSHHHWSRSMLYVGTQGLLL